MDETLPSPSTNPLAHLEQALRHAANDDRPEADYRRIAQWLIAWLRANPTDHEKLINFLQDC